MSVRPPSAQFLLPGILLCCSLSLAAFPPRASAQTRPPLLCVCMFDTPKPLGVPDMQPVYRGMAVSGDGGATWRAAGWTTNRTNDVASPPRGGRLYLANDNGLLASDDAGMTWTQVTDWRIGSVLAVCASGDSLWIGTPSGVYFSSDAGAGWSARSAGLRPVNGQYVAGLLLLHGRLIAATADGIYGSADAGATWTPAGLQGTAVERIVANPFDGGVVAAASLTAGIAVSTDGGVHWTSTGANLPTAAIQDVAFIAPGSASMLAGTTDRGILATTDGGATWTYRNAGLTNTDVTALLADAGAPSTVYAGTENGTYRSRDGGRTWEAYGVHLGTVSVIRLLPAGEGR